MYHRHRLLDIHPHPARTLATLGVEGRAPYQFDVQTAVFLSDNRQFTGRIEGAYVGINWTRAVGRTADYAGADGNDTIERSVVAGIRFWY